MRLWGLTCALFISAPAFAEPLAWGEAGEWVIYITSETDRTCFAARKMEDGSHVQFGFDPAHRGGFLAIYNAAWTHIEKDQTGLVEFDFGDARFAGEAEARFLDGVPGGYAIFNNPAFVEAIARKNTVEVKGSHGAEYQMQLKGTQKATIALRTCQDAQNNAAKEE